MNLINFLVRKQTSNEAIEIMLTQSNTNHDLPILIIDDLPTVRRIVKNLLTELGFTNLTEAENGEVGFQKLQQGNFALVISDWNMPQLDGLELFKLMQKDARLKTVPFLMCTSVAEQESVKQASQAGITGYLVKPFNAALLSKRLEMILKN